MNENLLLPAQRTEQWHQDRAGKFTGSRFVDVTSKKVDGEPLKAYHNLIDQLVVERLTGMFVDSGIDSASLRWGREVEPFARQAYEFENGVEVRESGFVRHGSLPFVGVSPDGIIIPDGGVEIKCPKNSAIHLSRFHTGITNEFLPQVQGCIWVCERDWWDWVSFDPRFTGNNSHLRYYCQRIYRDDKFIADMERSILLAEAEVRTRLESYSAGNIESILFNRTENHGKEEK